MRQTVPAAKRQQHVAAGANPQTTFATKYRRKTIIESIREPLYEYIGGIIRAKNERQIEIGGMPDHIHILAQLSPSIAVSDAVRELKANSAKWLNEQCVTEDHFQWQKGYGAFTVSYSQIEVVQNYIQNQEEHHRTKTFQEEYEAFLKRHGIEYRREYLFEDEHHG